MKTLITPLLATACLFGCVPPAPSEDAGVDAGTIDAGTDAGVDAGSYSGRVSVTAIPLSTGGTKYMAGATMNLGPQHVDNCTGSQQQVGACCYFADTPPATAASTPVSAGNIFIANATQNTQLGVLGFDTVHQGYFLAQWMAPDWAAGDTLTATASGDVVPAFSLSAPAPVPFASLTPVWTPSSPLTVAVSQDLVLHWQAAQVPARTSLLMAAENPDAGYAFDGFILCDVDDATGTVTVAQALLSHFRSGDVCSSCSLTRVTTSATTGPVVFELRQLGGGNADFR